MVVWNKHGWQKFGEELMLVEANPRTRVCLPYEIPPSGEQKVLDILKEKKSRFPYDLPE